MAANTGPSLENELNTYRTIQKEIGKVQSQVGTAQTQILENEMVLKVRAHCRSPRAARLGNTRLTPFFRTTPSLRSSTCWRRTPPSSS